MRIPADERVRRTQAEWRVLMMKFEASDESETAVCRKAQLSRSGFRERRKRLAEADATPRRGLATRKPKAPRAGIVDVTAPTTVAAHRSGAELELLGGVVLR